MADTGNGAVVVAAEAAASAAAQTAAIVAAAEDTAARAIENAETRVAAAEAVTQQVADAALFTKIGGDIAALETRVTTWQGETATNLSALKVEVAGIKAEVVTVVGQIAELLKGLSTPPTLPASPEEPQAASETIIAASPEESAEATLENEGQSVARKVRRVFR